MGMTFHSWLQHGGFCDHCNVYEKQLKIIGAYTTQQCTKSKFTTVSMFKKLCATTIGSQCSPLPLQDSARVK